MINGKSYEHPTVSALYPGTMLRRRYRIKETLGQGGYGITYSALDTKNNCMVAIKELFPSRSVTRFQDKLTVQVQPDQEETFRYLCESFEKEARLLIELQKLEGIVNLKHVFSENNTVYYVMELLEGEDMMRRLRRTGPMRWDQLRPVVSTIMTALERIHAVGLIHRDISPDNIFLTKHSAYLIDFGSARKFQNNVNFTAIVKQNFAPWEQFLSNSHQGPWTDVYALASTIYYSLTGQLPPPATERWAKDTLTPLENLCPGLPEELYAAVRKGMAVSAEARFQNISQFKHALNLEKPQVISESHRNVLVCLRGIFSGQSWYLSPDSTLRIGRNPDCDICYPKEAPGVSRIQCEIFRSRDGRFFVRDYNSTYGTRLMAGDKNIILKPGAWYTADGAHIIFGAHEEYVLTR